MSFKEIAKREWASWLIMLVAFIASIWVWDMVPDRMPTHWNFQGEVDGYGSKTMGLLLMPVITILVYGLIWIAPYIDPKKRIEPFAKPLPALRFFLVLIFTALHFAIIGQVIFENFFMNRWVYFILTLLFLVLGNYMSALKPNYFIGIRTPWTLENKTIWRKTHRMAAKIWTFGSIVLLVLVLLLDRASINYAFITMVMIMALVPTIYSFYLYKMGDIPDEV